MHATEFLAALDAFLEAVLRTRREQATAKATATAQRAIAHAFREQGRVFLTAWERRLRRAGLHEGSPPPPPPPGDPALALSWEPAFSEAEIATLQLFEEPIQALVEAAIQTGARAAIADLSADISFSLANPRAVAFLEQYGARRVTMINETTRSEIQRMVARGVREGLSYDQVAKDITARFREFSVGKPQLHIDSRAHLVAIQESGEAYEHGNLLIGQQLRDAGIEMEKAWSTVKDSRVSDLCRRNEAAGWIDIDSVFPSGHTRPLGHVACRCAGLLRRKASPK